MKALKTGYVMVMAALLSFDGCRRDSGFLSCAKDKRETKIPKLVWA